MSGSSDSLWASRREMTIVARAEVDVRRVASLAT